MTPEPAIIDEVADEPKAKAVPRIPCRWCKRLTEEYDLCEGCRARKHRRLRGSDQLLYTLGAADETHCPERCRCGQAHPCYYRAEHTGHAHKFTTECSQQ